MSNLAKNKKIASLVIPSIANFIPFVYYVSNDILKKFLNEKKATEFLIAIDEAITNIIHHQKTRFIKIEYSIINFFLRVDLINKGEYFNISKAKITVIEQPLKKRREGGMGIYLIRRFSSKIEYKYEKGVNILSLFKSIKD